MFHIFLFFFTINVTRGYSPPQIGDIAGERAEFIGERNVEAFGRTVMY